jgi:hypothetical protein
VFPKLAAEVAVRSSRHRFDVDALFQATPLARALNRDRNGVSAILLYSVTSLTRLVASVEADEERFTLSPIRDARVSGVHGAVQFNPRALIFGVARVGYQRFRPSNVLVPPFSGLVWTVDLGYRIRESTRVGFSLEHRPSYSYAEETPYYMSQSIGASFRRQLASRVDIELRGRRGRYEYRRLVRASQPPEDVAAFIVHSESVALHFTLNRNVTTALGVAYWNRAWSGVSLLPSDGMRVGLTTSYRF